MRLLALAVFTSAAFAQSADQALVAKYCSGCHNDKTRSGNFSLQQLDPGAAGDQPQAWEKVARKVRAGMMPPSGMPRPERTELDAFAGRIEASLDRAAAQHPDRDGPAFTVSIAPSIPT